MVLNFSALLTENDLVFISPENAFTLLVSLKVAGLLDPSNVAISTIVGL